MFPFFGRHKRYVLGIDIGTSALKIVELLQSTEHKTLENYSEVKTKLYLPNFKDALNRRSETTAEEELVEVLRLMIKAMGVKTRDAVLSIPVFASFSTILSFPASMKESEMKNAVPYEAKSHVPMPLTEVELDWIMLPAPAGAPGTREVLIVAVPKETVEKYQRIAERAEIRLIAFEVETFSLARAVLGENEPSAIIVDIGTSATSLTIVDRGFVRLSHSLEMAGSELTRVLAQGMRVSLERAEELKHREGIAQQDSGGVRSVLVPFIDRLVAEIERFLLLYERRTNQKVSAAVLTGGSSLLPGLMEYMALKLKRPVRRGGALARVDYPKELAPLVADLETSFAVAVGLALRELT